MIQEGNLHWRYIDTECLGLVMPWYTLPCLKWLKEQPTKNWRVFEYGSGYSNTWWRLNSRHLDAIESNEDWAKAFDVGHAPSGSALYIEAAYRADVADLWDCIIVDGIDREDCVKFCVDFIKPGGVLIIDNFESENYDSSKTEELLRNWRCDIYKQPNHSIWQTAVFKKPI